ncbi:MAG: aldo/keto reductase [Gemmatimonadaceae bacterium]|nr:aldo/keto reductase [Gemmatimonadaceae bacterium]
MTSTLPGVTLAPGYTIPRIIKGGWQLAGGHGAVDDRQAIADMHAFADAGVTAFDCADIYTGVEALIGRCAAERRATGRPPVHVHTKCVPDLALLATLSPAEVRRIVERSRERLALPTIDLVQFHWWDYDIPGMVRAAQALAQCQRDGWIRLLGATNCDTAHLAAMVDAGVPLVTHQVQYSLLDRRPANGMAAYCAAHGIALLCYGALAGGFLHERWLGQPAPAEPLENRSLVKYRLIIDEFGGWDAYQQLLVVLARVAARHHTTIGAVAIRWVLDQPAVGAVIVGARNATHLGPTLAALSLSLDADDHALLAPVLAAHAGPPGDCYTLERDRDGRHGSIMRYNLNAAR